MRGEREVRERQTVCVCACVYVKGREGERRAEGNKGREGERVTWRDEQSEARQKHKRRNLEKLRVGSDARFSLRNSSLRNWFNALRGDSHSCTVGASSCKMSNLVCFKKPEEKFSFHQILIFCNF